MYKLLNALSSPEMDEFTKAEIRRFTERKLEEHREFSAQIARDLRLIGDDAFMQSDAYEYLRGKYSRANAHRKKIAILNLMEKEWCHLD